MPYSKAVDSRILLTRLRATLAEQGATTEIVPEYYSVKEAIFPFAKFQNVDPILGPEMRSTGEVMGVGESFGAAFARAQEAASIKTPPTSGKVFVSVRDPDKKRVLPVETKTIQHSGSPVPLKFLSNPLKTQDS